MGALAQLYNLQTGTDQSTQILSKQELIKLYCSGHFRFGDVLCIDERSIIVVLVQTKELAFGYTHAENQDKKFFLTYIRKGKGKTTRTKHYLVLNGMRYHLNSFAKVNLSLLP